MKAQTIENPTTKIEQIKWTSSYNTHLTAIENSCTKRWENTERERERERERFGSKLDSNYYLIYVMCLI